MPKDGIYTFSKCAEIISVSSYCMLRPLTKNTENVRLVLMNALKGENITSHLGRQHVLVQILPSHTALGQYTRLS